MEKSNVNCNSKNSCGDRRVMKDERKIFLKSLVWLADERNRTVSFDGKKVKSLSRMRSMINRSGDRTVYRSTGNVLGRGSGL